MLRHSNVLENMSLRGHNSPVQTTEMTTIGISIKKLTERIHAKFPGKRKHENLVDVLIAGHTLNATSYRTRKSRWKFVLNGAKPHSVNAAFDQGLLERKRAPRKRILKSDRGKLPEDDSGVLARLAFERERLFRHIMADRRVKDKVLHILRLNPEGGITAIRAKMESGTVPTQIYHYDKVVKGLVISKLYSRSHGYLWMGFRFFPHTYWISALGAELISQATP